MNKLISLKDNQTICIRSVEKTDAQGLLDLILESVVTSPFLMLSEGEIANDLETEQKWLDSVLEDDNVTMLVALHKNQIIANAELRIKPLQKVKHWGELGVTIKEQFRGKGLGKQLITAIIELAKEEKGLKYIRLSVFEKNINAIALYEKLGFEKCGVIKNAFRYSDLSYDNEIIMIKEL